MATPDETARANKIANDRIRPTADRLAQLINRFDILLALMQPEAEDWFGLFDKFTDKSPLVDPEHQPDPRNPLTPEAIKAMFVAMQSVSDFMHANNDTLLNLVRKIAVNPDQL